MQDPRGYMTARAGLPAHGWILWYAQPAARWEEALPVGNGRLGAMVFGSAAHERLPLNEDTLWSGGPRADADRPEAWKQLPEIRKLLFEQKYAEAEALTNQSMTNQGGGYDGAYDACYQTLGDLTLDFATGAGGGSDKIEQYRRELDLDTAVARVSYRVGDAAFTREVFASAADHVIVVRVACDKPGRVALTARLGREADARARFIAPIG